MAATGFGLGLQIGRGIFNDGESHRKADAEETRRQWEFQQRQDEAARAAAARSDYGYIADGGLTGITPNMTVAPGGMGPVADPALVDIRYKGGAVPAAPVAPEATGLATTAPPLPPVQPPAGAMTPADQTAAIGKVALRNGNATGFFAAQDRAKAQKKEAALDEFGHKLITMPDEELFAQAKKWVSDNPNIPGRLDYDKKTHQFTVVHDDGREVPMNGAQARMLALAAFHAGNGDVEKGLELQFKVNNDRETRAISDRNADNKLTEAVGQQGLRVAQGDRADRLAESRIKLEAANAARMAKIAERQAAAAEGGHWAMQPNSVGPNGFVMALDGKTGQTKELTGVKPLRDPTATGAPTKKEIGDMAKSIMESGQKGPSGKPMTMAEALDMAKDYYEVNPNSQTGLDVDAIAKALDAAKAGRNGGKTAGSAMPALGAPAAAAPAAAPAVDPKVEAQQIRARLDADQNASWSNLGGVGGRLLRGEPANLPLGLAERRALEERLRRLEGR